MVSDSKIPSKSFFKVFNTPSQTNEPFLNYTNEMGIMPKRQEMSA